jgi:anti-sigma factor (TIGR02949 family)
MGRLTCEEAVRQFFAYLDRALAGESLHDLETHLETCLDCCDKLAFGRQLDTFIKERLPDSPMPTTLERRIQEALRRA